MGKRKSLRAIPKVTRRARGTGSIFFDERRRQWCAKKKGVGEKRSRTQADVVAWLDTAQPPAPTTTLAAWATRWLAALDVREQSRDNYATYFAKRITPSLGALPVAKITTFDVQEAARAWGKAVGAMTVKHTLAALSACLQGAVLAEIIHRNPVKNVKRPRAEPPPPDPFTRAELRAVLAACLADPKLHPHALCAATGCRIGEALAYRVGDYDPAAGRWAITRTVTRLGTENAPKSRQSLRTIAVPPEVRGVLGRPFDTRSYCTAQRRWKPLLARLNLRHRGIHQLKHTVASLLLADGVPLADAAAYLGDTVEVLAKVYIHPVHCDVAARISGLLGGS